jgi:hypothetical protein
MVGEHGKSMARVSSWRREALGFGGWLVGAMGLKFGFLPPVDPVCPEQCASGKPAAIGRALKCRSDQTKHRGIELGQMELLIVQKSRFCQKRHYNAHSAVPRRENGSVHTGEWSFEG